MNTLKLFEFESQEIRFVDGKPVANDVAKVLGYSHPAKTVSTKVSRKNKGVTVLVTPGGKQSITVLEESGIYQLIFSSKLPYAEKFQDWVFNEVLPSIRKTGKYEVQKEIPLPDTHIEAVRQLLASLEEQKRLAEENEKMANTIVENQPKVDFADKVAHSETSLEFNEYAKAIKWGRNKLMATLRKLSILMKNSTLPYQRYIDAGYFEVSQELTPSGKTVPFALVTGKGQLWLAQKLQKTTKQEETASLF